MDSFIVAVNAVVPFLVYISFGYFVRAIGMIDEAFLKRLNQMVFKAFFPILMFYNMYQIDPDFTMNVKLLAVALGSLAVLILGSFAVVPKLVKGNPQRGVIIQALYRSNFILFALPLTESVFGPENTTLIAMMVAILIPIYNIVAVVDLEYFRGGKMNPAALIKNILKNPLILGAVTGLIFFGLGIKLPQCIMKPITQFANLTTPLALFVLGGTLHFSSIKGDLRYLVTTLTGKMIVIPVIMMCVAAWMKFEPVESFLLFTMYATPVAASSYPMAQNMGGDGDLAGEMVVISTAVSVITIFIWIVVLKNIGMI